MALTIEKISLPHAAVLAPMSGVTDMPFRRAVRRAGGGLLVTEMVASAAILRQVRNRQGTDLAHYGLSLEVMGFSGGYLSLSLDLPDAMQEDLGRDHVLRVDAQLSAERAMTVYGRINIAQGPDTASMLRQLDHPIEGRNNPRVVEFDLAYADLAGRPADKVWLDLIFEAPAMNAVTLTDLVMSRHPRAQI